MIDRRRYAPSKLDYDVGYLVKSPCRECREHHRFPECFPACGLMDEVQTLLAQTIVTTRSFSSREVFAIHLERRPKK
ncbi:MAG: hypothetical protein P8X55_09295 [Desulfosarcinaceae bacterium]